MKYAAKEKKKAKEVENKASITTNNVFISCPWIPSGLPSKVVTPTAINIGKSKLLGIRSVMSWPSLFRNLLSSVKITLMFLRTKAGIPINRQPITIKPMPGYNLAPSAATTRPRGNARPKTRFQKLSLFILASMKPSLGVLALLPRSIEGAAAASRGNLVMPLLFEFCSFKFLKSCIRTLLHFGFKLYSLIVPKFFSGCKGISLIVALIISFSGHVAFGARISGTTEEKLVKYITYVEKQNNIPSGLLLAIASVESGLKPFALNIDGKAAFSRSYMEAMMLAQEALKSGVTNIDLGVMQVNYRWHNDQFYNFEEMLHPKSNIKYAVKLLAQLYKQHGSWHKAVRYYHSATPEHHRKYSRKIAQQWLKSEV